MCFTCGRGLTGVTQGSLIASRYEVLEPIGKGGMGTVYKARDRVLDETVAIKVLRSGFAGESEMEKRFISEIKLARRVSHRNICRIHEYGEEAGFHYISMAFVDGIDLKRILKEKGPLPTEEAFDTAIQIAEGLQAIHDEGIVHRDLKTPNIVRDAKGVVRLLDFGIAKQVATVPGQSLTSTGMMVGTPEYVSPEQAQGGKVDHRSDLYALGVVVFELFTGRVPFKGDSALSTLQKHVREPPPLEGPEAALVPRSVVPVLRRALAKDPVLRYGSAREMAQALAQARGTQDAGATVTSAVTTPRASATPAPRTQAALAPTRRARERAVPVTGRPEPERAASRFPLWAIVVAAFAVGALLMSRIGSRSARPSPSPAASAATEQAPAPTVVTPPPAVEPPPPSTLAAAAPPPVAETPAVRPRTPEELLEGCERGVAEACFALAEAQRSGGSAPLDAERTATAFERACERGIVKGCSAAGFMYLAGRGVREDRERAGRLLKQACEGRDVFACNLLREAVRRQMPQRRPR
jgi:serine/threonine-protein kinase